MARRDDRDRPGAPANVALTSLLVLATAAWITLVAGCAGVGGEGKELLARELGRIGLELESDAAAGIPVLDSVKYVPCRVRPSTSGAVLPFHPAGYLVVAASSFDPARTGELPEFREGRTAILEALEAWARDGTPTRLSIRRNPYRSPESEAWDAELQLPRPR